MGRPGKTGLEDLAMMRSVHGVHRLVPERRHGARRRLVGDDGAHPGDQRHRTTRGAYPVLYEPTRSFAIGGSKALRCSGRDDVTLVGAGVTLHAPRSGRPAWRPGDPGTSHRLRLGQTD